MGREASVWSTFKDHMTKYGHFDRIENMVGRGRPDVNYCVRGHSGDIELKCLPEFPKRLTTVVACDHFTPQQRNWIRKRARAGGSVFVFIKIEQWWALLPGEWARLHLGTDATAMMLHGAALVQSDRLFPEVPLLGALTTPHHWTAP
jgi:hypothetical protein